MKVILLQDVKKLGKKNDVVEVNAGYAQNFLIKKGLAKAGTSTALNENKNLKAALVFHEEEKRKAMQIEADKINGKEITMQVKAGDNGKIFGSVTNKDIANELVKYDCIIDKHKVVLSEPIKQLGYYDVTLKFYKGISAKIIVIVKG